jgi:hypothetical protein
MAADRSIEAVARKPGNPWAGARRTSDGDASSDPGGVMTGVANLDPINLAPRSHPNGSGGNRHREY